jgi:hypothetical protein
MEKVRENAHRPADLAQLSAPGVARPQRADLVDLVQVRTQIV